MLITIRSLKHHMYNLDRSATSAHATLLPAVASTVDDSRTVASSRPAEMSPKQRDNETFKGPRQTFSWMEEVSRRDLVREQRRDELKLLSRTSRRFVQEDVNNGFRGEDHKETRNMWPTALNPLNLPLRDDR